MTDQTQWAEDFSKISKTPPEPGTVLSTMDDLPVKLTVELQKGASPFIFGRAYVSDLFGESIGWFLQGKENDSYHGYKCVLLPRARTDLIQKIGLGDMQDDAEESAIYVKSLKIIRYSHSGSSILCEVHEYLEEKEADLEPVNIPCEALDPPEGDLLEGLCENPDPDQS